MGRLSTTATQKRRVMSASSGLGPLSATESAIDLLLRDPINPRSIAFQLQRLAEALELVAPDPLEEVVEALRGLYASFVVQEFIEEAKGADLRCFVVGDQVVAAMRRQAPEGDFRSNLHLGGSAAAAVATEQERDVAVRSARALGLEVAGVDLIRSRRGPLVLSAAFTRTLSPERQRKLRGRWFRLHFQYLCAFDRPGDYDYFAITAGPRRLADRYAGRSGARRAAACAGHSRGPGRRAGRSAAGLLCMVADDAARLRLLAARDDGSRRDASGDGRQDGGVPAARNAVPSALSDRVRPGADLRAARFAFPARHPRHQPPSRAAICGLT